MCVRCTPLIVEAPVAAASVKRATVSWSSTAAPGLAGRGLASWASPSQTFGAGRSGVAGAQWRFVRAITPAWAESKGPRRTIGLKWPVGSKTATGVKPRVGATPLRAPCGTKQGSAPSVVQTLTAVVAGDMEIMRGFLTDRPSSHL